MNYAWKEFGSLNEMKDPQTLVNHHVQSWRAEKICLYAGKNSRLPKSINILFSATWVFDCGRTWERISVIEWSSYSIIAYNLENMFA